MTTPEAAALRHHEPMIRNSDREEFESIECECGDQRGAETFIDHLVRALTPHAPEVPPRSDASDCPKCGEWRDSPTADCAACGFAPRPCGDPLGACVYAGPHSGPHKVAPDHPVLLAATRTPEPPDSGPYEARVIEGSQGPMWEVIEHGADEAECLVGEEATARRIAAALNRAEPPDSGDGAAPSLAAAWAEVLAALPKGWGVGIEPSGRGYEVGAGRNQWHEWDGRAYPDLASALHNLAARLRSGSPAPEGGE